jgi:hypothetical protein
MTASEFGAMLRDINPATHSEVLSLAFLCLKPIPSGGSYHIFNAEDERIWVFNLQRAIHVDTMGSALWTKKHDRARDS